MTTPMILGATLEDNGIVVRALLALNVDATSRYTDETIGSNIRTSLEFLEQASHRYFYDRPGITLTLTTNGAAQVSLPGFRTITSVNFNSTPLTLNETFWSYPDDFGSGLYMAVGIRQFSNPLGGPAYLANSNWFDRGLDLHRYPADWYVSPGDQGVPVGDLVITGDGGYATGAYPDALLDAVKIEAAWKTKRAEALFSGGAAVGENVFDLSEHPVEVQRFVKLWRSGGTQAVSL
jgi:hypothetical protein